MHPCSVVECIIRNAEIIPQQEAIRFSNTSCNYAELVRGIRSAAAFIQQRGYHWQLLKAEKRPEFIYAYFGGHLAGVVNILVDPHTTEEGLQHILRALNEHPAIAAELAEQARTDFPWEQIAECAESDLPLPQADRTADLMFTSGTTGVPKCVPLQHGNILASAQNINAYIGNQPGDKEVLALPLCHSFGLGRLRCQLIRGGSTVILPNFGNERKIVRALQEEGVVGFSMVPAAWLYLKKLCAEKFFAAAQQLHYIEIGSAALPLEDKQLLVTRLPNTRICMHYGLTEASRSAFIDFRADAAHLDTIGKPAPNTSIRILAPDGTPCPTGAEGELAVCGAHVINSYLNVSQQESHFGSYFRTGDLGYEDSDGYLHLVGRLKEVINTGGKKVSPQEVEDVINTFPGVAECACIGIPDPGGFLGEIIEAHLVPLAGQELNIEALDQLCRSKLEPHKVPARYHLRHTALPRTLSGKLQRRKVAQEARQSDSAE